LKKLKRTLMGRAQDLQEQIQRISTTHHGAVGGERSDAIDHCLASIARLSTEVQDAASYLPAYDQRTYADAVRALNKKLADVRHAAQPRPKFAFKAKSGALFNPVKNESAISLTDVADSALQSHRLQQQPLPSSSSDPSASSPRESVEISDHEGIHIVLPTAAAHASTSGTVSDLHGCVVDLSQPPTAAAQPFAALYLKNIAASLIVAGHVAGAAHVTRVRDAVLVVACRQFRMHDSVNCRVYLLCSGRPIIEDCSGIRFAPLPDPYLCDADRAVVNRWGEVDDFKWLRNEQSPNWSRLSEEERVPDHVWTQVVPGGPHAGVEEVLNAVGIMTSK
jgi:hypothetical protein